ncbi:MAG: hypothetical protein FJ276_14200 [Planctomycetes bacterium]|nr:hypothetical protein [Planctomycetota bacterium]
MNGQTLSDIPAGQFVHFEITARLGADRTGTWTLSVTIPGQPPMRYANLPFGSPQFQRLTWVGFISNANADTVFYVDNLQLAREVN